MEIVFFPIRICISLHMSVYSYICDIKNYFPLDLEVISVSILRDDDNNCQRQLLFKDTFLKFLFKKYISFYMI